MSDYTKVNLLEIENPAADGGGPDIRFARKHLNSRDLGVTLERYPANHRSQTAHSHKVQEEAYVVVGGSGRVLLGKDIVELKQWDVVRVAPETVRAFEAGADSLELIAIGGPKPEEGDGVRADADWPAN